ncbi:hypothetical protein [Piscinibacter sakaiensis]|uniref:hypothetical protein n=1 Tax=Piscinibacter sakaiensis TaxID=1547922 RepID=UPI003AACFCDB
MPGFEPTIPSRPAGPETTSSLRSRFEVCPPSLFDDDFGPSRSGLRSLLPPLTTIRQWLATGWYSTDQVPRRVSGIDPHFIRADEKLRSARQAFVAALADLDNEAAAELANRARDAHTLRELWHLRNPLFTVVSIGHCEQIARDRLADLNRHFPIREQAPARRGWLDRLPVPSNNVQRPQA